VIDINHIIAETVKKTGYDEKLVEKVVRSMFEDVQQFTSKKEGYNIQIPQLGTFVFRASAIPNYANKQKGTLVHWISRLLIGEQRNLPKTIYAAKDNIARCFYSLQKVCDIKKEFIERHARYKPKTKAYLMEDTPTDPERMAEYIDTVKAQLFAEKHPSLSDEDLWAM
jgi:nucleoid DNA-binding protein